MSNGRVIELRPRPQGPASADPKAPGAGRPRATPGGPRAVPLSPSEQDRLPHRGRPADRLEPWDLNPVALRVLGDHARAAQLPLGTAGCIAAEHGLLLRELGRPASARLTAHAGTALATRNLTDASALYLRSLTHAWRADVDEELTWRLQLPARLSDRLAAQAEREELLVGDLEQARRWEIAAVLEGATMTEWALRALLATTAPAGPTSA